MFSNRKYVFETSETRTIRKIKGLFYGSLSFFLIYSITCFILLLVAKQESQQTRQKFFQKTPDLIVVFTGAHGRIPLAIKTAKIMKQNNILISGVHTKNTVKRILQDIDTRDINPNFFDLDYHAKNTVENVKQTLSFLRENQVLKEVIIVSHDYHILRIKAIVNDTLRTDDNFTFNYLAVNSDLSQINDLKIIYKEVFKFIRTLAYLALKNTD